MADHSQVNSEMRIGCLNNGFRGGDHDSVWFSNSMS